MKFKYTDKHSKYLHSDFKKIKYDQKYPDSILYIGNLKDIFQLDLDNEYVDDILKLIKEWDRGGGYNNLGAAQWSLYYKNILGISNY